jgi:hypothetical protein
MERPILFSTPMVRAILEGTKTQTRRVFKVAGQPITSPEEEIIQLQEGKVPNDFHYLSTGGLSGEYKCPYGIAGDILWVRETFRTWKSPAPDSELDYKYKADRCSETTGNWKPSIFMPKEACRIFLEIKNIRVERLQDISEADAKAEGVMRNFDDMFKEERYKDYTPGAAKGYGHPDYDYPEWRCPISSFKSLWHYINGLESWNSNPFVWVIEFQKVEHQFVK